MSMSDNYYYYDNTTEDFFRELNFGQQNTTASFFPMKESSNRISDSNPHFNYEEDNFEQNLRLSHSSPRLKYPNSQKRSRSTNRLFSSNSIIRNINNQDENISNEQTKKENNYNETNTHKWSSNNNNNSFTRNISISNLNISNDTFNKQYAQYRNQPLIFQKSKYYDIKTQTPTKKSLEISDSISIDYYYSKVLSFEVDPKSLHASFHKRTKHRKKKENYDHSLNFISKHLPNCELSLETIKKNISSSNNISISNNFDEETDRCWQLTLQRFRSMKSTKAVFNSIRLTDFKNYVLTQLAINGQNDHNNNIEESKLLKFQLCYQENDKPKINPDIIHLYAWHRLLIDPKIIVFSLTQLYQVNFCKSNLVENTDFTSHHNEFYVFNSLEVCISSIFQYVIQWISLFTTDFVFNQHQKKNGLTFFADDLINLIILIMNSFPQFKKSAMTILAVIYFIYNGEIRPIMFSHFPCLKPIITAKESFEFGRLIDLQVEPQILVKHFTYTELYLLRNVSRNEAIVDEKWGQSENVQSLFKRFNDTCSFILSSIVKVDKENQVQKMIYWISVMLESFKMRNYQLMFEIETVISSSLMKEVRASLPIAQSLKFDKSRTFLYSKSYENDIKQRREVCFPFFGTVFKKVLRLFRNAKLENEKTIVIDFMQIKECVAAVEFLLSEWGTQYLFELDSSLLKAVSELDGRIISIYEIKEI